jgi:trans-2,3-dihydro-3-hydroxyanthranilate isomerase
MRTYAFVTVDVFTDRRFGGNPLAVFPDASGLSDGEMQSLATEFNLSETTFVVPPENPANTARVRIFNRTSEMPFAGHPNVGTGWVLAGLGRDRDGLLRFEEIAGLVEVSVERDGSGGRLRAVTIAAPQPLSLGAEMPVDLLAGCAGLDVSDVVVAAHRRLPLYLYAQDGQNADAIRLRARMFSPLSGTVEDAATGSAATPLAALLLSLTKDSEQRYDITQGVEMGRPSLLLCSARRAADGVRASVGGGCVPVLKGEISL